MSEKVVNEKYVIKNYGSILKILNSQRILIVLIFLTVIMSLAINNFASLDNIMKIARQVAVYGIVSVGMTFVIMTGGIDISIGSTLALGGVVAGLLNAGGMPLIPSIILALLAGGVVGAINGFFISYCRILPFVATLGMMNLIRGLALILSGGQAVWGLSEDFLAISASYIWFIPVPVIIMVVVFIIGHFLLRDFSIGRHFLALGGSEEAAKLAGTNTKRVKSMAYIICGMLASASGIILASRLGTAQPNAGTGYELVSIASVVIGGTSLSGGVGTIIGTLWGTLILGLVSSALNQLGVQAFYQTMITGGIVILAVLFDTLRKE